MFQQLEAITARPEPFAVHDAAHLWTDRHISRRMLAFHLDETLDVSSRRLAFIQRSAAWITSRFQVGESSEIIDFGCGPGLYANRLARTGAQVTGIDFSPRSIGHARRVAAQEGLSPTYLVRDYLAWEPDRRCDLVLLIMCDLCALSPAQRGLLLQKFARALKPDGAVLLDVYSLHAFAARREGVTYAPNLMDGFWSPHRYHGFHATFKYPDAKVVLDKYTIVEADRSRVIHNWLQYFSPACLAAELSRAGLAVEAWHGDVAGGPFQPEGAEMAVIARPGTGWRPGPSRGPGQAA